MNAGLRTLLLCLPWLTCPSALPAQESLPTSISACASLRDDALRLDCFDALAGMTAEETEARADVTATPAPGEARTWPVGSRPADAPAEPDAEPDTEPDAVPPENQDLYGFETRATENIPQIQSRHVGQFEGWSGETVFPLENGQVWRQTQSDTLAWEADSPMITIEKGWFGSFRLSVEGINKSVRVERIE